MPTGAVVGSAVVADKAEIDTDRVPMAAAVVLLAEPATSDDAAKVPPLGAADD